MEVPVIVEGQRMIMEQSGYRFAPKSQKFIKFMFRFSDDWAGLTVFAQWKQGNNVYNSFLDYNDCVYMPMELTDGQCMMMLYGTGEDGVIGTTLPIKLCISNDLFVADSDSTVITQSLYDQLVAAVREYVPFERIATEAEVEAALGL